MYESLYNYRFVSLDGVPSITNGISGSTIVDPGRPLVEEVWPSLDPAGRKILQEQGFVTDNPDSQLEQILRGNDSFNHDDRRIEFTLMLHEDCNFRCVYCFQDFKNRKISSNTSAALLSYLERNVREDGSVYVHFFGGEPLLAFDELLSISKQVESICKSRHAEFVPFITTNGSLLDHEKIEALSDLSLAHVKITLDGPPEWHDLRRKQVGGRGTFATVFRNLVAATLQLQVILRVNVDYENYQSIFSLIDLAKKSSANTRNLLFDFNIVYNSINKTLERNIDYSDIFALHNAVVAAGMRTKLPPLRKNRHCKFNSRSSYLIDTDGRAFVCSKSDETTIGTLDNLETSEKAKKTRDRFQTLAESCLDCSYLPICGGGCRFLASKIGKPPCPPWTQHAQEYLALQLASQPDVNVD